MLSKERHDPRLDGLASELAVGVLGHDAGPDLDFVADLEDTLEDAATGDASLEVIDLGTGLVHVEGSVEEDENKFYPTPLRLSCGKKVNLKTTSFQLLPFTMVEKTVNEIKNHWSRRKTEDDQHKLEGACRNLPYL